MKQIMKYLPIIPSLILIFTVICCKKNEETVHLASVSTIDVVDLTQSSVTLRGNLSNSGANGPTFLQYGFCVNTKGSPTINDNKINVGSVPGDFSYKMTDLTPNITYYYRTFATNNAGMVYGGEKSFRTLALPILRSDTSTNVTDTSATISGTILHNGGNEIISAGICWKSSAVYYDRSLITIDINDNVLIAPTGATTFSFSLKGLHAYNSYIYCTYVTTNKGTFYAKWNYFKTPFNGKTSFVWDADNRVYNTVTIKDKVWMSQELKTKHYNNNDSIPRVNDILAWPALKTGAYRTTGGDESWVYTQKQYNYYAIIDSRNICPSGWHVSTEDDWLDLIDYFGGYSSAAIAIDNVMNFYSMSLTSWTLSADKTSAGTIVKDYSDLHLEKSPKYVSMSVVCVKD